jgi:hypothetical protein
MDKNYYKKYHIKNKERRTLQSKLWRQNNLEKAKEYSRNYYKKRLDWFNGQNLRRFWPECSPEQALLTI